METLLVAAGAGSVPHHRRQAMARAGWTSLAERRTGCAGQRRDRGDAGELRGCERSPRVVPRLHASRWWIYGRDGAAARVLLRPTILHGRGQYQAWLQVRRQSVNCLLPTQTHEELRNCRLIPDCCRLRIACGTGQGQLERALAGVQHRGLSAKRHRDVVRDSVDRPWPGGSVASGWLRNRISGCILQS